MILVWLIVLLLALIVLSWLAVAAIAIAGVISSGEVCPRCGANLGVTDRDRFLRTHVGDRFGGYTASDRCYCGWQRGQRP